MATPTKGFSLLFFTTLAVLVAAQQKTKIAEPETINVSYDPNVAVPIDFTAVGYTGPYDPADPKGVAAAMHRQMHITGQKNAEVIKSYIPPGLEKLAKKEVIKLVMNEGRRFAVSHPKETAELVGIATKAKGLVNAAAHKLKAMEKEKEKEEKQKEKEKN